MQEVEDRVQTLYLNNREYAAVGYGSERRVQSSRGEIVGPSTTSSSSNPSTRPTFSVKSSRSDSSGSKLSDCFDKSSPRRGSTTSSIASSTVATTAPSLTGPIPWHIFIARTTNPLPISRVEYPYNLPCEFGFVGCFVEFHPDDYEDWIAHSFSHFGDAGPPPQCICPLCDKVVFDDLDNTRENWRTRMLHVRQHFLVDREVRGQRPDFGVGDHMYNNGRMSSTDYAGMNAYSERPRCDDLLELGQKTEEMLLNEAKKKARANEEPHDLAKENRELRRLKTKGKKISAGPSRSWELHQTTRN